MSIMKISISAALGAFAIAALTATDAGNPVQAQSWASPYAWCAQWGGTQGGAGRECGYVSLEQCRYAVSGAGGQCHPNPAYVGPTTDGRRVRKYKRRAY